MIGKGANLPDEDHVMRYVPWTKLRRDEDENVIGFLPHAFELRPEEESLSVNWLEYFNGDRENRIRDSVKIFRNTRNVGKKSAFGIGNVGQIKATCGANGALVRIVYEPEPNNQAHSAIRRLPRDDLGLLEALAADAFVELVRNVDV
jgi:hypothetical protein